jgi:hypothetical protein
MYWLKQDAYQVHQNNGFNTSRISKYDSHKPNSNTNLLISQSFKQTQLTTNITVP